MHSANVCVSCRTLCDIAITSLCSCASRAKCSSIFSRLTCECVLAISFKTHNASSKNYSFFESFTLPLSPHTQFPSAAGSNLHAVEAREAPFRLSRVLPLSSDPLGVLWHVRGDPSSVPWHACMRMKLTELQYTYTCVYAHVRTYDAPANIVLDSTILLSAKWCLFAIYLFLLHRITIFLRLPEPTLPTGSGRVRGASSRVFECRLRKVVFVAVARMRCVDQVLKDALSLS